SALTRDYPMIMAVTLLYTVLITVTYLITDVLYVVVDPRVRIGQAQAAYTHGALHPVHHLHRRTRRAASRARRFVLARRRAALPAQPAGRGRPDRPRGHHRPGGRRQYFCAARLQHLQRH